MSAGSTGAAIVAVGSELLGTSRLDTNSLWLAGRLEATGLRVARKSCVGDDPREIAAELGLARARVPLVLVTGGLGPTDDDRTRDALALAVGRPLEMRADLLEEIRSRFARRGIPMPSINERQAMVVAGADPLPNRRGSAPGLWLEDGATVFVLLPGVPREMEAMFEESVAPRLARFAGPPRIRMVLKIAAMGESRVEERVRPVYAKWPDHDFTILASVGEVQLHLTAAGEPEGARAILEAQRQDFEAALPGRIYGVDGQTLEGVVGQHLRSSGGTVATAESCTGGLLGARLTEVPGSSDYYRGGVVAYSNEAKTALLGVPAATIEDEGAVSEAVARRMAQGVAERFGARYGIAVTGVAGPDGGTEGKPVGTVWTAIAQDGGETTARLLRLPGERASVRGWSVASCLEDLRRRLKGEAHA
jgi:nicotinamide-nucleotide amidase